MAPLSSHATNRWDYLDGMLEALGGDVETLQQLVCTQPSVAMAIEQLGSLSVARLTQ